MQFISEDFFEITFMSHLPHFEVCYSVFVKRSFFKRLLNLRKTYIWQDLGEGLLSTGVCLINLQSVHLSKVYFV